MNPNQDTRRTPVVTLLVAAIATSCASGRDTSLVVWPEGAQYPVDRLTILDGVILDGFAFAADDYSALGIVTVDSVGSDEAIRTWGEAGRNGAVLLGTRTRRSDSRLESLAPGLENLLRQFSAREPAPELKGIFIDPPPPMDTPLYVVDGSVMRLQQALEVAGDKAVASVYVVRGTRAAVLYGRVAWYGVVVVTTHPR